MSGSLSPFPEELLSGLVLRLRSVALALHRLDRLESGQGRWLEDFLARPAELREACREMLRRLFREASDATAWRLLEHMADGEAHPVPRLMEASGLERLPLTERINDLVQVGLAVRLVESDRVQATPAGVALVRWVHRVEEEMAGRLADLLRPHTARRGGEG